MSEQQQPASQPIDEQKRLEWIRPAVTRFRAGDAEVSDLVNTDGTFTS